MSWKTIARSLKNKDMRKRILAVLGMILVFRALAHIPIPLAEPVQLKQLLENIFKSQQVFGFIDILSGGALANFAIMLLGLGPYINASIIMQLLSKAIPKLEEISKDGESGRRRINQYTRVIAFPLAILQSIGYIFLIRQSASSFAGIDITKGASLLQWFVMVASVVGGSMLLMWLGEIVSEQGIGNGISLLIFAGIASRLPSTISTLVSTFTQKASKVHMDWFNHHWTLPINRAQFIVSLLALGTILTTYFVVKLNEAQRVISVNYAKRVQGNRAYGGISSVLPVKLITAGVVPIIFALAFLSVPNFVGQLLQRGHSHWMQTWGPKLVEWFQTPGQNSQSFTQTGFKAWIYPIAYFFLVFVFTYFYTSITFNTKEISENLQKQGGFIPEVRPGKQTETFLGKIVNRLTLFGALALGILAVIPILVEKWLKTTQFNIGGTSVLILVSVALETLRQIESRALMVTYDGDTYTYDDESKRTRRFKLLRRKALKSST